MPANNLLLLVEVVLEAAGRIAGKGLVIASWSSAETQWMGSERSETDTVLVPGQQGPFQVFGEHFLIDAGELHHYGKRRHSGKCHSSLVKSTVESRKKCLYYRYSRSSLYKHITDIRRLRIVLRTYCIKYNSGIVALITA